MALARPQESQGKWGRHHSGKEETRKCLESAVASHKCQISTLMDKNEKMMAALVASGFEHPDSNPSSNEEEEDNIKMAANKKISNLTKSNKKRKS